MSERRRFARILYLTMAELTQGEQKWQTLLADVSLQGALLVRPDDWQSSSNKEYQLSFRLNGSDIEIKMQVELNHEATKKLGFYCHHIDIDSATHLRRMIELNVGDEKLLHRELEQLLSEHLEHPHP
ncbi:MAG: PilZ domain-containing protein [Aeromonas sp.]